MTDWTPSFLPSGNLSGWYKADAITGKSDGDAVDSWTDSSGRSNTLTQSTAGAQPSYETNEINTLPIVRFDKDASPGDNVFSADLGGDFEPGTGDFYLALVVKFVSTGTQFIMSKADSGTQGLNMFISGSNLTFRPQTFGITTNILRQDSVVDSAFHVIVCRRVSGTLGSQFDGSPFTTDDGSKINNGSIANDANFNVGSSSTGGLDATWISPRHSSRRYVVGREYGPSDGLPRAQVRPHREPTRRPSVQDERAEGTLGDDRLRWRSH